MGGAKYGLAIFDVAGYLGHNGELPGFQGFMGYDPANGTVVVALTNLNTGPEPERPGTADSIARAFSQARLTADPRFLTPRSRGVPGRERL